MSLSVLLACSDKAPPATDTGTPTAADDGFTAAQRDCADTDATVNPDAAEVCDNIDNDCDGEVDEDTAEDALTFYADSDADGYGDPDTTTAACGAPSGYVADDTDCDDDDSNINPGQDEIPINGVDEDCDGTSETELDLSEADAKFTGESNSDHAGRSVSDAGDVDGDGYDDLLIGAYGEDSGESSAGAAYLILSRN